LFFNCPPIDAPTMTSVQNSLCDVSRASQWDAINIATCPVKYRSAGMHPVAPLALVEGSRGRPIASVFDRDFEHRHVLNEDFLFGIFRHEIVTFPSAPVHKISMSFAQHFSGLKFSSTFHEVGNKNVAEIALHKSSPHCNNRRASTKPAFLLVLLDQTAMEV
jgi:hypothetical protein